MLVEYFYHEGKRVKTYRGMGSIEAMEHQKKPAKTGSGAGEAKVKAAGVVLNKSGDDNAATARYFSEADAVKVAQGMCTSHSVLQHGKARMRS